MPHLIETGDKAPAFSLPASTGKIVSLRDFAGRQLVVFFYPKDDTEVCTREAKAFNDMLPKFTRRKISLLGISKDTVNDHLKFVAKYGLKLVLAADEAGLACESYGVWQEKQLYGRRFMGIVRSTFLVGPDSKLRQVWRNVRVPGHVEAVYEAASDQ